MIFGVSSLIDWTWFVPGVAVPALVCAGWLAGRGPLDATVGRARDRRRVSTSHGAAAAGLGVVAATIVAAWFVWQPLHSTDAFNAAIGAMSQGNSAAALADAQSAAASDPVSAEPLWELSEIYSARRDPTAAREELVKAANVQPANPETWEQLGEFDLAQHQAIAAVLELQTAQLLDRTLGFRRSGIWPPPRARCRSPGSPHRPRQQHPAEQRRSLDRSHPHLAEPELVEQRPERAPRVQVQMVSERVGEPLDAAERDAQAAVRRRGHEQPTAGREHPSDLREPLAGVGHVLDHLAGPHEVERAVLERQRAIERDEAEVELRMPGARPLSAASATSTPIASAPACARAAVNSPVPHPRSRARSPARTSPRRKRSRRSSDGGSSSAGRRSHRSS